MTARLFGAPDHRGGGEDQNSLGPTDLHQNWRALHTSLHGHQMAAMIVDSSATLVFSLFCPMSSNSSAGKNSLERIGTVSQLQRSENFSGHVYVQRIAHYFPTSYIHFCTVNKLLWPKHIWCAPRYSWQCSVELELPCLQTSITDPLATLNASLLHLLMCLPLQKPWGHMQ